MTRAETLAAAASVAVRSVADINSFVELLEKAGGNALLVGAIRER